MALLSAVSIGDLGDDDLPLNLDAQFGAPMAMSLKEDLFDFGTKAEVTAPEDDMVVDFSSLPGS